MKASLIVSATLFAVFAGSPLLAQNEPKTEVLRAAGDGYPIHITYYPVNAEAAAAGGGAQNSPVVVLLHGANENRLLWDKGSAPRGVNPFPSELQNRGYAVITVDLRKHGESVPPGEKEPMIGPNDYAGMLGDLAAVKKFIFDEHQRKALNMNKTGIIAVGMSVPIALAFAEADWKMRPYDDHALAAMRTPRGQDIRALVLISPELSSGKVQGSRSASFLRAPEFNIAIQIVAGADDTQTMKNADSLFKVVSANNKNTERFELVSPKLKDRGIELMTKPTQFAFIPILKFLDTHLKTVDSTWQDRRSRAER